MDVHSDWSKVQTGLSGVTWVVHLKEGVRQHIVDPWLAKWRELCGVTLGDHSGKGDVSSYMGMIMVPCSVKS